LLFFFSLAPQPSLGLGLLRNLLPLKMSEFLGGFSTFFYRVGLLPHAQPPPWRTRPLYLYPPEAGRPSYTPRHRLPILVASYDMHGLQWDYSYYPVTTREMLAIIHSKIFCLPVSYQNLKIKIYKTVILSEVLYGCETWSLTLREEHGLRVFENRMPTGSGKEFFSSPPRPDRL
jgi:hypothetical protein